MKTIIVILVMPLFLCGCDGKDSSEKDSSGAADTAIEYWSASELENIQSDVVFKAIEIAPSHAGEGYAGTFVFKNNSRSVIRLPGYGGIQEDLFSPSHVGFEILENGDWADLKIGYDGIPQAFSVAPHSECLLKVDLRVFKESGAPRVARIRVGGYTSEGFTLDWVTDRSEGRFELARREYLSQLRQLFVSAGFKESVTVGDDFLERLILTLLDESDADEFGFASIGSDLNLYSVEDLEGNLRFDFNGSVVEDYEYRYSGILSLNPSTFNPEWYRKAMAKHGEVGTWGSARTLSFDDGSGFYTQANKLFLEIIYRSSPGTPLPSEELSEEFLARILGNLEGCLVAGE